MLILFLIANIHHTHFWKNGIYTVKINGFLSVPKNFEMPTFDIQLFFRLLVFFIPEAFPPSGDNYCWEANFSGKNIHFNAD